MLTPTDMLTNMVSIAARITALELAVIAVAEQELGDSAGHPFRGNQYSGPHAAEAEKHGFNHFGQSAADHQFERLDEKTGRGAHVQPTGTGARLTTYHLADEGKYGTTGEETSLHSTVDDAMTHGGHFIDTGERTVETPPPEQRHGRAQGTTSYDSDDVETFSIDDDGTVTFGDSAGHPFRGNQYGEGHPDDVAAYHRAREGGADHAEALDSARRSAAERNARTSGTDPSWYGQ